MTFLPLHLGDRVSLAGAEGAIANYDSDPERIDTHHVWVLFDGEYQPRLVHRHDLRRVRADGSLSVR